MLAFELIDRSKNKFNLQLRSDFLINPHETEWQTNLALFRIFYFHELLFMLKHLSVT